MNTKTTPRCPWLVMVALAMSASCLGPVTAETEAVTLTGEVEAADFDDDGGVAAVAIYDFEWGSVLVAGDSKGKELLDHVGDVVRASGYVEPLDDDSGYFHLIRIQSYSIEEAAAHDDDADDPGR